MLNETPVWQAVVTRRSIRRYTQQPVTHEQVERLLMAAAWSPSAHNRQPWRFVVVREATNKDALARAMGANLRADLSRDGVDEALIAADVARSYERLTLAPVLVVLCLTMREMDVYTDATRQHNEQVMAIQSVAMAGQNLLLVAHEMGLGACWVCAPLFCPPVVRDALALPKDWQAQGLITLGYPAQTREKTREPLETRVLWR